MPTPAVIREQLAVARRELLDLGLRNPLLSYKTTQARGVDVCDEVPAEIYKVLVEGNRAMSFLPTPEREEKKRVEAGGRGDLFASGDTAADLSRLLGELVGDDAGGSAASRHTDSRLQTPYTPAVLQSRLLASFYAARTFIEEQGVSVLYLALGMLEWYQDDSSDQVRRAPLLLVPVEIERTDVRSSFRLRYTGEDVGGNLTLQAKLRADFGVSIPLPDPEADLDVAAYFRTVADVLRGKARWRVDRDAVHLGFFLFGKLLMYNDLDVDAWPGDASPLDHEVIGALLGEGFGRGAERIGDDEHLDRHLHPDDVHQVVDADSTQTLALLDVKQGHHLVIQGPPGTGKSQTITNVIAEAVGQGKTVLFVAEKMAALEVVKRRLDAVHLGEACLELHSHKTNKKDLLAELERTLRLGKPTASVLGADLEVLVEARDDLNVYAEAVNAPVSETGVSPHDAYGHMLGLTSRWDEVEAPALTDPSMASWTRADHARRRNRVEAAERLVAQMGRPVDHPFWGSARLVFLPTEQAQVVAASQEAAAAADALHLIASELTETLGLPADTPRDVSVQTRAARRALSAPDLRGVRVDAGEWHARRDDLGSLLDRGEQYARIRSEYEPVLIPEAWEADLLETRQHLAAHGEKWYRVFIGDWRRSKARLAGLMTQPLPDDNAERLAVVDGVLGSQRLRKEIETYASLGSGLFGLQWQGPESDWGVLRRIAEWMGALYRDVETGTVPRGLVAFLAGGPDLAELGPLVERAEGISERFTSSFGRAVETVEFKAERRFGSGVPITEQRLVDLAALARLWADTAPRLQEIVSFNHQSAALADDELVLFAGMAASWEHAGTHLVDAFEHIWYSSVLDAAYASRPSLARFSGVLHNEALRRFVTKDETALYYNQARLALGHWEGLPRHGLGGTASGQLGKLQNQFSRRRGHWPVRKLMVEAGRAVQAIKPVFMMGPMSVAAYLPPGSVEFDLVVFDEASQVKPVDAFGALLRGRQAVVVGDSKQLPPTSFFDSVVSDDVMEDEETSGAADVESVLELFKSKQAPERMLRWHYRSRHESLIAVSNKEFYDNKLVTFPSPDAEQAEVGLAYHHLPEARYDKGGRRSNRDEARAVAQAVAAHAKATPELSLMVATFSQAQQKEVRDQVDILSLQDTALGAYVHGTHPLEPFDVKNLENIQGDERDVVFISVGYGRDQNGAVSMNFGPLNRDGGERRLNVLISRARRRCEVFTNLRSDDIDLSRTQARGVSALKRYLQYADTGVLEMDEPTGRGSDSPFEDAVADALRAAGHRVEHQIGVGGFRIDLAVVDPQRPGRYLLGIECDGATYHSARTARDRDRIRQSVLEGLGWQIHRVWSTDWFRNPKEELRRAAAAIERAKAEPVYERAKPPATSVPTLSRVAGPAAPPPAVAAESYRRASIRGHGIPIHEVSTWTLAQDIVTVVRAESPVHVDEVARRVMEASGVTRLGSRIRSAVEEAARVAVRNGEVVRRGEFLYLAGQLPSDVPVRDRSVLPTGSRSFDYIAPEEVRAAITQIITSSFGISADALPLEVCRLFGFGQTSTAMRVAVEGVLADMWTAGSVAERRGALTLTSLPSTDHGAFP